MGQGKGQVQAFSLYLISHSTLQTIFHAPCSHVFPFLSLLHALVTFGANPQSPVKPWLCTERLPQCSKLPHCVQCGKPSNVVPINTLLPQRASPAALWSLRALLDGGPVAGNSVSSWDQPHCSGSARLFPRCPAWPWCHLDFCL